MSRGPERGQRENYEQTVDGSLNRSRMPLSQGRSGGSGATPSADDPLHNARSASSANRECLAETIERIARAHPTMSELIERLDEEGIRVIPSTQSSGRLNGMAYEKDGLQVTGSELGRAYTALGLQRKFGVQYEPSRDDVALARAAGRLPIVDGSVASVERSDSLSRTAAVGLAPGHRERDRSGFNDQEKAILATVGSFRVVGLDDLRRDSDLPTPTRLQQDLRRMVADGFMEEQSVPYGKAGQSIHTFTLTKNGIKQARATNSVSPDQRLYAGFVKPNEMTHDLAIFRMYQAHSDKIARAGGTVHRVVLDFELKRKIYSDLAKASDLPALAHAQRKEQIAAENGLKVVEGRIILPDLRIEYETEDGERSKVDLEVTSADYKRSQMQQKARAGFGIYALGLKASSRCSAIQDGPEVVEGILSF